jgi:hypothetical protein
MRYMRSFAKLSRVSLSTMTPTLALSSTALGELYDQLLILPKSFAKLSGAPLLRTPLLAMTPTLTAFWKLRDQLLTLPKSSSNLSGAPLPAMTPTPPSTVLWKLCG